MILLGLHRIMPVHELYQMNPVSGESVSALAFMLFISYFLSSRFFLSERQKDVLSVVVPTLVAMYLISWGMDFPNRTVDVSSYMVRIIFWAFAFGFSWHAMRSSTLAIRIIGNIYTLLLGCITVYSPMFCAFNYGGVKAYTPSEAQLWLAVLFGAGWLIYALMLVNSAGCRAAQVSTITD